MQQTAVVMAGGKGERFWPQSRTGYPKQFLSLTKDGKTMLQLTVERLLPLVSLADIFISTNESYRDIVAQQLPELPPSNILCEPKAKNTAPCIAYAAAVVAARYNDAVMYVMASDHVIQNSTLFTSTLRQAGRIADCGYNIVTLGITPSYPETGYGYIRFTIDNPIEENVFSVEKFVEKPDLHTAKQYLDEGCYLWNSGMFVWKVSTFMENCRRHLPVVYDAAQTMCIQERKGHLDAAALQQAFDTMPSVSVDYGIMEKASDVYTIPGCFGWDDVGSWLSLARINKLDEKGNFQKGEIISIDNTGCTLIAQERLVAAVGLEDMVIVETGDAVLVCHRQDSQRVKDIVQKLKEKKLEQYL